MWGVPTSWKLHLYNHLLSSVRNWVSFSSQLSLLTSLRVQTWLNDIQFRPWAGLYKPKALERLLRTHRSPVEIFRLLASCLGPLGSRLHPLWPGAAHAPCRSSTASPPRCCPSPAGVDVLTLQTQWQWLHSNTNAQNPNPPSVPLTFPVTPLA